MKRPNHFFRVTKRTSYYAFLALRQRIRRSMVLPDVLVIGAQKAGTTTLFSHLEQHPDFLRPLRKELHYFDLHFERGPRWYGANFPVVPPEKRTGEASPDYLFHPHCASRIAALCPAVKLIVLLRDPVKRAYSHYQHNLQIDRFYGGRREPLSFSEAIRSEPQRTAPLHTSQPPGGMSDAWAAANHWAYVKRGQYMDQLDVYLQYFKSNQIMVLLSEEFYREPQRTYDVVCDFVDLPRIQLASVEARNSHEYAPMDAADERFLSAHFQTHNQRLASWLGRSLPWS